MLCRESGGTIYGPANIPGDSAIEEVQRVRENYLINVFLPEMLLLRGV